MNIISLYLGKKGVPTPSFYFDEKETKKGTLKFLKDSVSGQTIKVPPRLYSIECEDSTSVTPYDENEGINLVKTDSLFSYIDNKGKVRSNINILLNLLSFSPYFGFSKDNEENAYVYLTIDTTSVSVITYESHTSIINTFRNPKEGILGCLIHLEKGIPFKLYTRDESRQFFKCLTIVKGDEDVEVSIRTQLSATELNTLRRSWSRKKKTRTFIYNAETTPSTKICCDIKSKDFDTKGCIEIPREDEVKDKETWIKEIEKSIVNAVGYVPKAIEIMPDVSFSYEDLIALHLNYVIAHGESEDGKRSYFRYTAKSN